MSAANLDVHPNPQPDAHHRKVDLQSPLDLTYLQTNLANFALQKLDLHFPKVSKPATHIPLGATDSNPTQEQNGTTSKAQDQDEDNNEDEEDPMRRRVRDLVTEFLTTTWTSAGHNISVNGIDASTLPIPHTATLSPPPSHPNTSTDKQSSADATAARAEVEGIDFQYSAFDASLQHKVAALYGELEALTAQVSKLRRTAPAQGAEAYQAKLEAVMEADDARFEREMEDLDEDEVHGMDIDEVRDGWNEDVREMYEQGTAELASLAGVGWSSSTDGGGTDASRGPSLTETVGKAQRAHRVAMELE